MHGDQTERHVPERLQPKRVSQVFVRMASIYKNLWTSTLDSPEMLQAAKDEWSIELAGFTTAELSKGLRETKRLHPNFPPTLPQFRSLCRQPKKHALHELRHKALPRPKADESVVSESVSKLKELLK